MGAIVQNLRGAPKAFGAVSKDKLNAIVDGKAREMATKPKGMIKDMPDTVSMAKKTMDAMNSKGGKVDNKA